jgi:hypothetical protein
MAAEPGAPGVASEEDGMAYRGGAVTVASANPTLICTPQTAESEVMVQNLGAVVVTLGGPGVTAGQGVALPAAMTTPIMVPSGIVAGEADLDDGLYGRAASSTSNVVYLVSS